MSSLTERAHGTAVERVPEGETLQQQIRRMETQFAMAMPKGIEAAQLVRDALTCLKQTPKLAECTPASVLGALMTCAQLGLRPGVGALGHAWVLPYWDSKSRTNQAQLIIGYKGYVELAYRSGQIASIIGRTAYDGDTFDVEYGLDDKLVHRPNMETDPRGRLPIAHYSVVRFANGGRLFWVMSNAEAEAHRDRHAPTNRQGQIVGPWKSDFEAMARKTTLLRLASWMPKSTDFAVAMEIDGGVRVDVSPAASLSDTTYQPARDDVPDEHDAESGDSEAPSPAPDDAASQPEGDTPPAHEGTDSDVDGEGAPVEQKAGAPADEEPVERDVVQGEVVGSEKPPPRPIGAGARRGLMAQLSRFDLASDEARFARLAIVSVLVGREIESTSKLTSAEGQDVTTALSGCRDRAALDELVAGIRAAEGGA